jgi:hypothetical protein
MTSELFEEYAFMITATSILTGLTFQMDQNVRPSNETGESRSLSYFSAHNILYTPQNVRIEHFEPNLTLFVQPLDAGIIRCFKVHYRHAFCLCTIKLDDAGGRGIYKINLREAMVMARDAWNAVEPATIGNC